MNMSFRVKILIVAAAIFILKHYPTSATTSRNVCSGNSCYANDEDYKNLTLKWMTASQTFNQLIWPERSKLIHILQDFISSDVGLGKSCKSSCRLIIDGLKENKLWALKFLDSSGRGRAGMAYGYTSDVGNLDECITNDVTVKGRRINGKYCLLNLNLPLLSKEQVHPLHGVNFSLKETPLEGTVYDLYSIFVEMMIYSPAGFKFGLCLPASCSAESVEKFINKKLEGTELSASFSPHCDTIDDGFETHHVIIIGICVSYVLFVAFCTAWTWNREDDGLIDSYHQHFNIFHNTNKLFVETKDPVSKQISFFHGIRFFYQLAAITFHTIDIFPFLPTVYAAFYIRDWPFWLFKQGYASIGFFVQIPFAVSGFLTYVTMYPYFKLKKGKVSFGDYIFKRWFRTTPTIFGVILFGFAWSAFGRGPVHKKAQDMTIEKCKTWWWTNLLYINNWWHFNDMCIFHTWTYSADFQLYTLCFITFMLMIRDKRKGLLSILCFITFGCCASAAVTYFKDLAAYPNFHAVDARQYDYSTWFYFHTYHTIPAYFIGVLTAYLFLEKKQIPDSWIPVVWVIVVSMGLSTQLIPHYFVFDGVTHRWLELAFAGLHRLFFVVGWVWTGYLCCFNLGGIIQYWYEVPYFIPFGRMSTSVFLAHYTFVWYDLANSQDYVNTRAWSLGMRCCYTVVCSYVYSYCIYLLFEAPSMSIAKALMKKGLQTKSISQDQEEKTETQIIDDVSNAYCRTCLIKREELLSSPEKIKSA